MPNRILRDWTDSEPVNALSWQAECLFIRLIMKADDYGRFHANPRLLKSLLFPLKDGLRDADIARWIAECEKSGLLRVYTIGDKPFIEIGKFGQRTRATKSRFPDPPENDSHMTVTCQSNDSHMTALFGDGDDKENISLAGDTKESTPAPAFDFPHSAEEVMELAKLPYCGMLCTREQADAYFTDRVSRDWIPYGQQRQMKSKSQICADLKKWLMRDKNNENERKAKRGDVKHNFDNDPAKYGPMEDEPEF